VKYSFTSGNKRARTGQSDVAVRTKQEPDTRNLGMERGSAIRLRLNTSLVITDNIAVRTYFYLFLYSVVAFQWLQ